MDSLEWNLDQREFQIIEIIQIQLIQGQTDLSDSNEKLRLLVLSHQIAQFGIPAFFLESSPSYVKENFSMNPVVMVFDFADSLKNFQIPPFFNLTTFTINFETTFTSEISDHIQRALMLLYYYKHYDHSPLYHTSFLLFPSTDIWYDPFLVQFIPVRIQGRLRFRTLVLNELKIQIDCKSSIKPQSIVLISPFEHPFFVIDSNDIQITAQYVDKTIHTFSKSEIRVSRVLKPSPSLFCAFQDIGTIKSNSTTSSESFSQIYETGSNFVLSEEELRDFFNEKIESKYKKELEEMQIESSEFKDSPATIDVILTEQIMDSKFRKQVSNTLKPLCLFPSKKQDVTLSITQYDTYYEKNYGLSKMSVESVPKSIYSKASIPSIKIEIPNVIVAQKGQIFEISAKNVIKSWIPDMLRPISGPKNAHYKVYADSILSENHTKQFLSELIHEYSLLGFGKLDAYSKEYPFCFSNPEEIKGHISTFIGENKLLEFNKYPTIIFIFVDKEYRKSIQPNMHTIFIDPHYVNDSNIEYFKELSFHVYSQIRIFSDIPSIEVVDIIKTFNPKNFIPTDIFFGFRYQPPFLLQRMQANTLIIRVFWDPISTETVWTDDAGSTLHVVKMKNLSAITSAFDDLLKVFNDIKLILSIGIVADCISPRIIDSVKNMSNINLYTITATPYVQVYRSSKFKEDSIIFTNYEQTSTIPDGNVKPLLSCFVVSKRFPSYQLSLYFTSNSNQMDTLKSIATNLSNLSWLSVKPGSEKRTVGYPPGLNLLFQKMPANSHAVNLFEFLPYNDLI